MPPDTLHEQPAPSAELPRAELIRRLTEAAARNREHFAGRLSPELTAQLEQIEAYIASLAAQELKKDDATAEVQGFLSADYDYEGHTLDELAWRETRQRPIWGVESVQRTGPDGTPFVEVEYRLGAITARPGRGVEHQLVALQPIDARFTPQEWQVVEGVLARYDRLERIALAGDGRQKEVARKLLRYAARADVKEEAYLELLAMAVGTADETPAQKPDREFLTNAVTVSKDRSGEGALLAAWIDESVRDREKKRGRRIGKNEAGTIDEASLRARLAEVASQLLLLNGRNRLRRPPKAAADFEEIPYMEEKMQEIAQAMLRHLIDGRGMVHLVGDMGSGKNYIIEHLATLLNRQYLHFVCGKGMEIDEMVYHQEFSPEKGTTKLLTNLAKGLQTPGAIVAIDELNALDPEVVAGLHSLADHNQAFRYNGIEFRKAPGVILVVLTNPAGYEHAKNLGQAISDRMGPYTVEMGYAPLTPADKLQRERRWTPEERANAVTADNALDKIYLCDEVLIYRKRFPALKQYTREQFEALWDAVVNSNIERVEGDPRLAAALEDAPTCQLLFDLRDILRVAAEWRRLYAERRGNRMTRTISYRGMHAVVERYLEFRDVRTAFLAVMQAVQHDYATGPQDVQRLHKILVDTLAPPAAAAA